MDRLRLRVCAGVVLSALSTSITAAGDARLEALAATFVSDDPRCAVAAEEAKVAAMAAGIGVDRLEWLYVRKPFEKTGHVVLLIDRAVVVDNGGLGVNLWGESICPGRVCTYAEARRGVDAHFAESAALAVRHEFSAQAWRALAQEPVDR